MVPGTLFPKPLQQALQVQKVGATQAAVAALPHHPPSDIVTLQHNDPIIKEVLVFWRCKQPPNKKERKNASHLALVLLQQ